MRCKKTLVVVTLIVCLSLCLALHLSGSVSAPKELGTVRLNIETYLAGKNQPTHPSVVAFPTEWNGAKYWLAYSPYPYGNGEEENPCLAISNDLLYWETPVGLANPIADNEETGCNELKDPHLLYREDLERLEMWYLGRMAEHLGGDGKRLLLMRKFSYDGVSWSNFEIMAATEYLSPTIYWDGTKYQQWAIGYNTWGTEGTIVYQESTDGIVWSEPIPCFLGELNANIDIWHGSVTVHNGMYHFVFVDNSDKQEVFYCTSEDGIHFSEPEVIIENDGYWDYLYRPTLVHDGNNIYCLYGVINHANQWYISMSVGPNEDHLSGIREPALSQMKTLNDEPTDTHSFQYCLRKIYDSTQFYLRLELLILAVFEAFIWFFIRKLRHKYFLHTCGIINVFLSILYIYVRICPFSAYTWIGANVAVLYLNVSMAAILQCLIKYSCKGTINENKSA